MTTPEPELAPKDPLSATKQNEMALQSDNGPGAKPELNVEAEAQELVARIKDGAYEASMGLCTHRGKCTALDEDSSLAAILALIQQVSDQRLREFAEALKGDSHYIGQEKRLIVTHSDIDQTLSDYLSHKEQSHD